MKRPPLSALVQVTLKLSSGTSVIVVSPIPIWMGSVAVWKSHAVRRAA